MLLQQKCQLSIAIFFAVNISLYSQKNLQETIYHRNEISMNMSPVTSIFISGKLPETAFSFGYAHNFGNNHFLRTGIKLIPSIQKSQNGSLENIMNSSGFVNWQPGSSTAVISDTMNVNQYHSGELKASIYIGYEHLFGRKIKFLLGIDVLAGFNAYHGSQSRSDYYATYTPDTINQKYNANFDYLGKVDTEVDLLVFHTGFSPRLGIRLDASKRISFTIVYTPLFYIDMKSYRYTSVTDRPALSIYGALFMAETGFIFKL